MRVKPGSFLSHFLSRGLLLSTPLSVRVIALFTQRLMAMSVTQSALRIRALHVAHWVVRALLFAEFDE
jgi:hypothetical protein